MKTGLKVMIFQVCGAYVPVCPSVRIKQGQTVTSAAHSISLSDCFLKTMPPDIVIPT